jgi:hypothetical protein
MSDQQAPTGNAQAHSNHLAAEANLFLFDLHNEATERGFKQPNQWQLQLATDSEISYLKKHHHPIVTLRLQPDALINVYQQVKYQLQQLLSKEDNELTSAGIVRDEKKHLVAYPNHK